MFSSSANFEDSDEAEGVRTVETVRTITTRHTEETLQTSRSTGAFIIPNTSTTTSNVTDDNSSKSQLLNEGEPHSCLMVETIETVRTTRTSEPDDETVARQETTSIIRTIDNNPPERIHTKEIVEAIGEVREEFSSFGSEDLSFGKSFGYMIIIISLILNHCHYYFIIIIIIVIIIISMLFSCKDSVPLDAESIKNVDGTPKQRKGSSR